MNHQLRFWQPLTINRQIRNKAVDTARMGKESTLQLSRPYAPTSPPNNNNWRLVCFHQSAVRFVLNEGAALLE